MIVMPANNTCWLVSYWQGLYGGLGHLYGPDRFTQPTPHLPYVLDNGAFGAFKSGKPWSGESFSNHVEKYAHGAIRPQWVVVPDVVGNAVQTVALWRIWAPILRTEHELTLALAVQDGMIPDDVRKLEVKPDVIFVGGSTEWKWATMAEWCQEFPRVHVGRVNTEKYLSLCATAGAESCDGTGWFRGRKAQIIELGRFLAKQSGKWNEDEEIEIRRIVAGSRVLNRDQKHFALEVA